MVIRDVYRLSRILLTYLAQVHCRLFSTGIKSICVTVYCESKTPFDEWSHFRYSLHFILCPSVPGRRAVFGCSEYVTQPPGYCGYIPQRCPASLSPGTLVFSLPPSCLAGSILRGVENIRISNNTIRMYWICLTSLACVQSISWMI